MREFHSIETIKDFVERVEDRDDLSLEEKLEVGRMLVAAGNGDGMLRRWIEGFERRMGAGDA